MPKNRYSIFNPLMNLSLEFFKNSYLAQMMHLIVLYNGAKNQKQLWLVLAKSPQTSCFYANLRIDDLFQKSSSINFLHSYGILHS